MTNPNCPKCGEMMSKGWIDGFVTKYSCRHCKEAKAKEELGKEIKKTQAWFKEMDKKMKKDFSL